MSQPGDLPRYRAVVHQPRASAAAPARARRDPQSEVDTRVGRRAHLRNDRGASGLVHLAPARVGRTAGDLLLRRSEEHTSELQSRLHLVCRLLLEKKKKHTSDLSLSQSLTVDA